MATSKEAQSPATLEEPMSIISTKDPAVLRIQGLLINLLSNLEKCYDMAKSLELELDAVATMNNSELRICDVAFVKEKVSTCASEIMSNDLVQNLLRQQSRHAQTSLENQMPSESSPSVAISRNDSIAPTNAKRGGILFDISRKALHRRLWSTLPVELVEQVVSRLPLRHIVELCKCSESLSKSSNFLKACAASYPKVFGLSTWNVYAQSMRSTVYDVESQECLSVDFGGILEMHLKAENYYSSDDYKDLAPVLDSYEDAMFACDKGLVCFVPRCYRRSDRILVCNPLTNAWKFLKPLESSFMEEIIIVRLLTEEDGVGYKVILVAKIWEDGGFIACVYCSKSGNWNRMDSGAVCRTSRQLKPGENDYFVPYVFDCTTGLLHNLTLSRSVNFLTAVDYAMSGDQVFVLNYDSDDPHDPQFLHFSVFSWNCNETDLKIEVETIDHFFNYPVGDSRCRLFVSGGFALLMSDDGRELVTEFHDLSGETIHFPTYLEEENLFSRGEFMKLAMSELRWDVSP